MTSYENSRAFTIGYKCYVFIGLEGDPLLKVTNRASLCSQLLS